MRRNISSVADRSHECKAVNKQTRNIQFNYDKSSISCFISKRGKKAPTRSARVKESSLKKEIQDDSKSSKLNVDKDNLLPPIRRKTTSLFQSDSRSFSNKLLFLQYDNKDVYVDQVKKNSSKSRSDGSKKSSPNDEQDQFVTYCVRAVTEETTHSSNAAHFTPNSLSPSSSQHFLFQPCDDSFYCTGNKNGQHTRNKRTINFEESQAYVIFLDMIQNDGRTTLMVRNIPNRYTQEMLLQLFYKNHRKKIDFFYLPIDFKNKCNVGYAFINFIHAKFIKDFYLEFHNKKWQKFNSQKICHICYARIQGTAQLSSHFEYSSVLQQRDRRFRPLIGLNDSVFSNLSTIVEKQKMESEKNEL